MDALIETCVNRKLEQLKESPGVDFVDAGLTDKAGIYFSVRISFETFRSIFQ